MAPVRRPIFLLSDFGLADSYVGQMRAVIASIAPECTVHDLTHAVEPFAVDEGAWLLETALGALPADAVVVAVVDPGVGTHRRPLVVQAGERTFVGPDNGLLSAVIPRPPPPTSRERGRAAATIRPIAHGIAFSSEAGIEVRELCEPSLMRSRVSATFHGRDVFAPAAAHIANGADFRRAGPPCREMLAFPPFCGETVEWGVIAGYVVHVDHFGNLVTTVRAAQLFPSFVATVSGRQIDTHVRTFGEVEVAQLFCHVDSSGFLAIAMNRGSAAAELGVGRGAGVAVRAR